MSDSVTLEELVKKYDTLESKMTALDTENKDLKAKLTAAENAGEEHKSKVAGVKKGMGELTGEEEIKEYFSKMRGSAGEDKEMLKAIDEVEKDIKITKGGDGDGDKPETKKEKELTARLTAMEAEQSAPLIATLVAARRDANMSADELTAFELGLKAKRYVDIKSQYASEVPLLKAMATNAGEKTDTAGWTPKYGTPFVAKAATGNGKTVTVARIGGAAL